MASSFDPVFLWLETSALSQWVVGSPSLLAFPGILTLHAIGMGFAAGLSLMIDLRILGVAPGMPLAEVRRFLPFLWAGFWVNAVSGVLLLIGYPTKALTNPVFYLKIALIVVAMAILLRMTRRDLGIGASLPGERIPVHLRRLALASIICWTGALTAGRLLAYTYTRLTVFR